jgi:hypothetical protein
MVSLMSEAPAKQRAHALIDSLPDDASWSDILYALELAADIDQGRRDAESGQVMDSAAVLKDLGLHS